MVDCVNKRLVKPNVCFYFSLLFYF